ncbi:sulfurtransferase TusA [Enterobacteriaceae endosymbiont of Plateumaris sericea]|uniref:sulfurtransferase TusA family protein n=1 Tax=Enterobacteriaceae endosymbiont of Plateumaris sericea TaxID=2675797 RepID=UPI001448E889|nr:sulfurtransferase TusA family protein [Enterobacteriaceae endosymbiont of Plateumaris sericea]QJC29789.1 sulfurtransferase TusA [Enterobacteriaceae endosymbiont of Plateumaris sericea]
MDEIKKFYKNPTYILNIKGLQCPKTIIMIKKSTINMILNQTLLIITDNNLVYLDIKQFCLFMNYKLIKKKMNSIPYLFLIKKL